LPHLCQSASVYMSPLLASDSSLSLSSHGQGQIALSVISPRQLNELSELFHKVPLLSLFHKVHLAEYGDLIVDDAYRSLLSQAALQGVTDNRASKPDTSHMVLLRGLKIMPTLPASLAPPVATAPALAVGGAPVPAAAIPAAGGPMAASSGVPGIPSMPSAASMAATAVGGNVPGMVPSAAVVAPMGSMAAPPVANTSPSRLPVGVPAPGLVGVSGGMPSSVPVIGGGGGVASGGCLSLTHRMSVVALTGL
jgi:hypothetical protein